MLNNYNKEQNEYSLQFWQGTFSVNKTPYLLFEVKNNNQCSFIISTENDSKKINFFEKVTEKLGGYKRQKKDGNDINKWFKVFDNKELKENVKDFIENDKKIIDLLLSFQLNDNLYSDDAFNGLRFITKEEFENHLGSYNIEILKKDLQGDVTLKSIELENIARFENIKIDFNKKLTCIIAENGVGKSTILSSIALAIAGFDANSIIKNEELEFKLKIKEYTKKPIYEKSGFIKLEYEADKLYTNKICFEHLNDLQPISISDSTEFADSFALNTGENGNYLKQLIIGFPQGLNLFEIKDYNLNESDKPNLKDLIPLILGQINNKLSKDFSEWLKSVSEMKEGKEQILTDIFRIISRITESEISLREIYYDVELKQYVIVINTKENPNGIPINLISQGLSNVVIWIGNILRRMYQANYKLENIKEVKAIVIIDEIDKYLHPKWQSRILKVLLDELESCQFIITTHSAIVLDGLEKGQIVYLKNENGKIIPVTNESDIWGWHYEEILSRFMGVKHDFLKYDLDEIKIEIEELKANNANEELIERKLEYYNRVKESQETENESLKLVERLMKREVELQNIIKTLKK